MTVQGKNVKTSVTVFIPFWLFDNADRQIHGTQLIKTKRQRYFY